MILVEEYPRIPELADFVDRYQLYVIDEESYIKTVPNGKIELFYIIDGSFNKWNDEDLRFDCYTRSGFFPATNQLSFIHIPKGLVCLNIKLNMSVLSLSYFENFIQDWATRQTSDFLNTSQERIMLESVNAQTPSIEVDIIDNILLEIIEKQKKDLELKKLIALIEKDISDQFKVTALAEQMNMSSKTLERMTKKFFNLTPKDLWKVIRFEHATSHLKKHDNQRLINAISFGYYDQSHFIKECKKVTGYTPTEFFSKLKFSTNDLIIESDNPLL